MGEAKRRKRLRGAAVPDVIHRPDPLSAGTAKSEVTASDRAHIARTRQACRKQSRKVLQAAKAAPDPEARKQALAVINQGTGFIFDRQIQDFFEGNRIGRQAQSQIACGMGCYACCHLYVVTTPAEAITIALHVQTTDPESVQKVAEVAPEVAGLSSKQRLEKNILCPLLKKGLCSVHEMRPLKCRRLFSFDEKACQRAFCGSEEERANPKLPVFALPSLIEPAISDGVRLACADEGLQDCNVELIGALNLIFSDPTAVDRWFQGEAVFTPSTET